MSNKCVWLALLCMVIAAVGSVSADDPNQPVVDPNQPVVDPNQPVVEPNQPVVEPNQPVVEPNEPVVEPNEPVVEPNEPVVEPNEPVVEPNLVVLPAYDPRPSDGAINRRIDTQLSWKAGDTALHHEVFLGTSLEDVAAGAESVFQGNQEETTFDPNGDLAFGTTYYWRVDEFGEDRERVVGAVWSFTTRLEGADQASNESPVDGAEGRPDLPVLSWTAGVEAVQHMVYLGTVEADVTAGNASLLQAWTTDTFFVPAAPLAWNTTYYWRVDEVDVDGCVVPGPVWRFKVADYVWVADGPLTLEYDNTVEPYTTVLIQEFATPQNWTKNGVTSLQLEIKGQPERVAEVNDTAESVVDPNQPVAEPNEPQVEPNEPVVEPNEPQVVVPLPGNDPAPLYVAVTDSSGNNAVVAHPGNPGAVLYADWTPWKIPLSKFAGVNLKAVTTMTIGVGDGQPGGTGSIQIRDVRVVKPLNVTVVNPSFEQPGVTDAAFTKSPELARSLGNLPGWSTDKPTFDAGFIKGAKPTQGSWSAYLTGGSYSLWQLTDHVIVEGEVFQLNVEALVIWGGVRDDKSNLKLSLYYVDGGKRVTVASSSTPLPYDPQPRSLTFSASEVRACVGQQIGIELSNVRSDNVIGVDNVRFKVR